MSTKDKGMTAVFGNGLTTGLILQLAVGPVFFFIINLALQRTVFDGLVGAIAVTVVDYFYILLSILGIGALLERKKVKRIFGMVSSVALMLFGALIFRSVADTNGATSMSPGQMSLLSSFASVFFLTISSPMTIVFFTSLFTAKAVEYGYTKKELILFGVGTGLATFIFMGTSVLLASLVRSEISTLLVQILNSIVGCLLIVYGGIRFVAAFKKRM